MTMPYALLLFLLCSTGGEVQSFTVPTLKFRYQTSWDIHPEGDIKAFYNSRLTVLSASPKGTKPKISNFFQRFSTSSSSSKAGGGLNEKIKIISKRPKSALPDDNNKSSSSGWKSFKETIYGTVDAIGRAPSNDDTSSDLGNRNAPMAYSNTVGETTDPPRLLSSLIPQEPKTPMEKALMQYQTPENEPIKVLAKSYNDELDYVPMEEDDLYRSDSRKKFDSAKDRFYNSLDFISRTSRRIIGKKDENQALLESDSNRVRPMAKTSINKVPNERNRQRRENELKRKQSIDGTKETIYGVIDGIKSVGEVVIIIPEKVGETKNALVDTVEGVKAFPGQVKNFVGDVRESVEETKRITEEVSTDIKNIPKTVEEKITETQDSIRETKESIRQTKEELRNAVKRGEEAIYSAKVVVGLEKPKPKPPPPPKPKPASKIAFEITGSLLWGVAKGSTKILVGGTKLAWSAYKASNAVSAAKESNGNVGVVDKAVEEMNVVKPKPNIQDADVVGKAVQQINVEKTKPNVLPKFFDNVFKLASAPPVSKASTTTSDVEELVDEVEKKMLAEFESSLDQEVSDAPSVSKASTTASGVEKLVDKVEKKTLAEFDPALDKEVNDALRLAEEALEELEKEEVQLGVTNDDIDSALMRAKIAAAKAKMYATELEDVVARKNKR